MSSDPITAASKRVGWLSVHVNANDVACSGAKPKYFISVVILPSNADEDTFKDIMEEIRSALNELGCYLLGGHSEVSKSVSQPIISGTMIGYGIGKPLSSAGCKKGDLIILTKFAGLEGTAVLADSFPRLIERSLGSKVLEKARKLIRHISVVKDALIAHECGANALHDPTEGGVVAALYEMSVASNVEIEVNLDKVPMLPETHKITRLFGIDPYRLLSSGALLISIPKERLPCLKKKFTEEGVNYSIIGRVVESGNSILKAYLNGRSYIRGREYRDSIYDVEIGK